MQINRRTGFILAILAGLVLGLVYGWLINPPDAKNTRLDALRSDYQADYVLMVAEKYSVDQDTPAAINLLRGISPSNPLASIKEALILGQQLGYSAQELQTITALQSALASPVEATP